MLLEKIIKLENRLCNISLFSSVSHSIDASSHLLDIVNPIEHILHKRVARDADGSIVLWCYTFAYTACTHYIHTVIVDLNHDS